MGPSDSLAAVDRALRSSLASGLTARWMLTFLGRLRVHPSTRSALESGHRVPIAPVFARRETRGSLVPGPSSSPVPCSTTPPVVANPRPSRVRHRGLQAYQHPRQPECFAFRGCYPSAAHALAYLRIAVGLPYRRKARYRLVRLHPGRAGFAPAGRQTEFHRFIASPTPFRPALPGRTGTYTPSVYGLNSLLVSCFSLAWCLAAHASELL